LFLKRYSEKTTGCTVISAAQAWNHAFYFNCPSPKGGGIATGEIGKAIINTFGSFE
jgi:Superoxide dismutase